MDSVEPTECVRVICALRYFCIDPPVDPLEPTEPAGNDTSNGVQGGVTTPQWPILGYDNETDYYLNLNMAPLYAT
jgi:hypothetical protein